DPGRPPAAVQYGRGFAPDLVQGQIVHGHLADPVGGGRRTVEMLSYCGDRGLYIFRAGGRRKRGKRGTSGAAERMNMPQPGLLLPSRRRLPYYPPVAVASRLPPTNPNEKGPIR